MACIAFGGTRSSETLHPAGGAGAVTTLAFANFSEALVGAAKGGGGASPFVSLASVSQSMDDGGGSLATAARPAALSFGPRTVDYSQQALSLEESARNKVPKWHPGERPGMVEVHGVPKSI